MRTTLHGGHPSKLPQASRSHASRVSSSWRTVVDHANSEGRSASSRLAEDARHLTVRIYPHGRAGLPGGCARARKRLMDELFEIEAVLDRHMRAAR